MLFSWLLLYCRDSDIHLRKSHGNWNINILINPVHLFLPSAPSWILPFSPKHLSSTLWCAYHHHGFSCGRRKSIVVNHNIQLRNIINITCTLIEGSYERRNRPECGIAIYIPKTICMIVGWCVRLRLSQSSISTLICNVFIHRNYEHYTIY